MIPSGDDGVGSLSESLHLLRETARRGTRVQYGTPHVTDRYPLGEARRRRTEEALERLRPQAASFGLDLRLGWELSPVPSLLELDPLRLRLGGLRACLLEMPLPHTRARDLVVFEQCAAHIEEAGLSLVVGHPERCAVVQERPAVLRRHRERGRLLQVNGDSLLGRNGRDAARLGWSLVEQGLCDLVGSDGHRASRPPYLDEAYAAVAARAGEEVAMQLLTGAALHRLEQPGDSLPEYG